MDEEARNGGAAPVVVADSVTTLPGDATGAVLVTGSHGGLYPAAVAARARPAALVFHDAGIGLERAGVAALDVFDRHERPAVAIGHRTARIGSVDDMMARGRVSAANAAAARAGVAAGMAAREAVARLAAAGFGPLEDPPEKPAEARAEERLGGGLRLVLVDSAALVAPSDAGAVVVTGSHGGLVGGDPARALKADARLAVFNDAGIGIDEAGIGRLAALDARGIAAVAVAADTARIGDARSALATGVASRVNRTAAALGATAGRPLRALVDALASDAAR